MIGWCKTGVRVFAGAALVAMVASCGGGGGGGGAAPTDGWKLVLAYAGGSVVVPLEVMNVWLVEDEFAPERFNITGEGVALGGSFPAGLRVGYQENWNALLGKTLVVTAESGDPNEQGDAFIELSPGERSRVSGGTITFEKLSGKTGGVDGDMTLTGRVMLVVSTSTGIQNLMGTISVHCVTWG